MLHSKEQFLVPLLTVMNGRDFISLFAKNHNFIYFIDGIICFSGQYRFYIDEYWLLLAQGTLSATGLPFACVLSVGQPYGRA
jgi:hypothetical protein